MKKGINIDEAMSIVLSATETCPVETLPIVEASNRVLAQAVAADRDYPAFNRAMMDGFAVRTEDAGQWVEIIGEVAAGQQPEGSIRPGTVFEIMTGAPCPEGCEAVVKVEDTTREGKRVKLPDDIKAGQHFSPKGSECQMGRIVADVGDPVTALVVANLATVGIQTVRVIGRPSFSIISTGNEVLAKEADPTGVQIRDSNGPMLTAWALSLGAKAVHRRHAMDTEEDLARVLSESADDDIVILSGGVSAGKYDLVPRALAACGAELVFHKVLQKPGLPLLFAKKGRQLFFGLPGTPLGSHMSFHRYIKAVMFKMMGRKFEQRIFKGRLSAPLKLKGGRFKFVLVKAGRSPNGYTLDPTFGKGSSDVFANALANAYLRTEGGSKVLAEGEEFDFEWIGEET